MIDLTTPYSAKSRFPSLDIDRSDEAYPGVRERKFPTAKSKNLSSAVDRLIEKSPLKTRNKRSQGKTPKNELAPCKWHLTYYTENGVEHHYPIAVWPEDAVLKVGRGLPLKVEFDHTGSDRWTPIGRHLYLELAHHPKIAKQQASIDLLKQQRECSHAVA